ncbi:MAG: hypothetical protein HQM16_18310, partial [Deltaproteobacteria bacterium]|nr:hypothetical protein [Deltaproteobacteria bacterium]
MCEPGSPLSTTDTTCDNVDDDCDGTLNEDYSPTPTTCGVGACSAAGATSCVGGAIQDNCTPLPAGTELCDSIDNDCNGTVNNINPISIAPLHIPFALYYNHTDNKLYNLADYTKTAICTRNDTTSKCPTTGANQNVSTEIIKFVKPDLISQQLSIDPAYKNSPVTIMAWINLTKNALTDSGSTAMNFGDKNNAYLKIAHIFNSATSKTQVFCQGMPTNPILTTAGLDVDVDLVVGDGIFKWYLTACTYDPTNKTITLDVIDQSNIRRFSTVT